MADAKQQAQATFRALCDAMDAMDWKYKKEDGLQISTGARGDDLPINMIIRLNEKHSLIKLLSFLDFTVPEDKRIDTALAVCVANDMMVHGSFDLDMSSGRIYFRMSNSFIDSQPGEELFFYLILCTCKMVDEYNDRFLMLAKDMIDLKKFIELANN